MTARESVKFYKGYENVLSFTDKWASTAEKYPSNYLASSSFLGKDFWPSFTYRKFNRVLRNNPTTTRKAAGVFLLSITRVATTRHGSMHAEYPFPTTLRTTIASKVMLINQQSRNGTTFA